jgi:hypothetical protein
LVTNALLSDGAAIDERQGFLARRHSIINGKARIDQRLLYSAAR